MRRASLSRPGPVGGLALTEEGIFRRDKFVVDQCASRKIPLCITLSGGYWKNIWRPSARMFEYAAEKLRRTRPRPEENIN